MKSFPSSLNKGNSNIIMNHSSKSALDALLDPFKDSFKNAWESLKTSTKFGFVPYGGPVDIEGLPFNDSIDKKALLDGIDFARFRDYKGQTVLKSSQIISPLHFNVENPYNFDNIAIAVMNKYSTKYFEAYTTSALGTMEDNLTDEDYLEEYNNAKKAEENNKNNTNNTANTDNQDQTQNQNNQSKKAEEDKTNTPPIFAFGAKSDVKRSIFNPYNSVHVIGITQNVPLVYDQNETVYNGTYERLKDISDCSISKLVKLSAQRTSILGQARYKYADFAFCKHLGMPNNRLITLRRFTIPVGDNIFEAASHTGNNSKIVDSFSMPGDVGRMCCYFDTEDNKLEDILKYNFAGTWKDMKAEIQQEYSQEENVSSNGPGKGPLSALVNTFSPSMNENINRGFASSDNHLLGRAFSSWFGWDKSAAYDKKALTNYDQHKIYTPRNTIQSMHKYEGNLEFKHEFTLVFSYKLRGYQNINPKSAMLDLLANVIATTYSKGSFWGGRNEILGAQPNKSGWNKANKLVNKAGKTVGGLIDALAKGNIDFGAILGSVSKLVSKTFDGLKDVAKGFISDPMGTIKKTLSGAGSIIQKTGLAKGMAGMLRNQLGRPNIYTFQSLLDGSNTGVWHVTIGNPLNPIASMGNMIITDTQIQQLGPLGIDDFPTELKVTVSLKHARPRDAVAIEKMYTKGVSSIYFPLASKPEGEEVFRANLIAKPDENIIGRYDYYGDYDLKRIKRNAEELS